MQMFNGYLIVVRVGGKEHDWEINCTIGSL